MFVRIAGSGSACSDPSPRTIFSWFSRSSSGVSGIITRIVASRMLADVSDSPRITCGKISLFTTRRSISLM